jgi:AcrR family transcriptional regulator
MALYHHVADKDEILDAMVDRVFEEIGLPVPGAPWRAELERRARSAREAFRRHPWAVVLMDSRTSPGLATLRHHDAIVGCLRAAGMSIRLTAHAVAVLDTVAYGFAVQEAALPFSGSEDAAPIAAALVERIPSEEFPHIAEMAEHVVLQPGYDFGDEFDYVLALVLDGLEARFAAERAAPDV